MSASCTSRNSITDSLILLTELESELQSSGHKVRRTGRVMRIVKQDEDTYSNIISCAAKTGSQLRQMKDHEPSLEDLFIVIMERLGYSVKSSSDLLSNDPSSRKVDAPANLKEGGF